MFVKFKNKLSESKQFNFNFSTDFSTTHQEGGENSSFANFGRGLARVICKCAIVGRLP